MVSSCGDSPEQGLTLYHTLGCHLCELADALVAPLALAAGVYLERVDIADDEQLLQSYGTRIPVLRARGRQVEEIGWPFDARAVSTLLLRLRQGLGDERTPVFR